ncbi:MAG: YeeE/YedE family protein [Geobacteraceae bacterium]|nr:YeeE/YedE family protein [Geobacteraceae bacterium]
MQLPWLGMAIGGFIAGRTFAQQITDIPAIWAQRFGKSPVKRYAFCFLGGFLILFGARLAGGCTLGLFLSGSTQLALSGIYFGVVIFGIAMLTTHLLFKNKRDNNG